MRKNRSASVDSVLKDGPWTRRRFFGALGAGLFAGSVDAWAATKPPTLPQCAGAGPARHERIDAHIHIFNGTDLQVAGFLKESVAGEYPAVAGLLQLIADPLQAFVWTFSPKAVRELRRLTSLSGVESGAKAFSPELTASAVAADRAETDAQYAQFLLEQFQREDVRAALSTMLSTRQNVSVGLLPTLQRAPVTGAEAGALAREVDRATGIPIFDYLKPYFSYRYVNFFEAVEQFTCRTSRPIDTFVALMVDFDQPLAAGKKTPSSIPEQIAVISAICELSRGRLLALAPYCPFKDVAQQGASLQNVITAWTKPGFVGAKMYPPMNFKPFDNGDPLDGALTGFYHECVQRDAVVVAHAGSSLCIHTGACASPGPEGWGSALDHVLKVEKAPLRASLGHFGGPFGVKPESLNWPEAFLALMERPSGARLYADLGYAREVLQTSKQKAVVDRLSGLLTRNGSVLGDRLLYGTDWLMLGLESHWRDYAQRMETVIQETERKTGLTGFGRRFFGTNARTWLGLDSASSLASRNTAAL
jgi:amidohydrolase family protein